MERDDKIIAKLGEMDTAFNKVVAKLDVVETKMIGFETSQNKVIAKLGAMDTTVNKLVAKLVEMDLYLHEEVATKDALRNTESRIMNHIDGFAKKQGKFDQELVAARSRMDRIEGKA